MQPQTQPKNIQQIQSGMTYAQITNNQIQKNSNKQIITGTNQPSNNMTKLKEMLMKQMDTMPNLLNTVISKLA